MSPPSLQINSAEEGLLKHQVSKTLQTPNTNDTLNTQHRQYKVLQALLLTTKLPSQHKKNVSRGEDILEHNTGGRNSSKTPGTEH